MFARGINLLLILSSFIPSASSASLTLLSSVPLKQPGAPWGLARLSHRDYVFNSDGNTFYSNDNNAYFYYGTTQPVTVYMLDTGVDITHQEFDGRAVWGKNFIDSGTADDNGHGTHLAGIAIGNTKGVARNATLVSVKILDSQRIGTVEHFDEAVDWVVNDTKTRGGKAVINYSALGPVSDSRSQTIQRAIDNGIFVVNAAGNNATDACQYGPGNMGPAHPGLLISAALNYTNQGANFSNVGSCVDIWAPGVNIESSLPGNTYGYMDGTSNAAAFVTGLVAYIWGQDPSISISDMTTIVRNSNRNAVHPPVFDTTDSVIYNYFSS